jgi:hypothetical protein
MKELGRLLNKKTIMIMIAAAFICVAAVVARDFSDCGIDNYNVKVREYHWLEAGHTDDERKQHLDSLSSDERRIYKRLAKEYDIRTEYIEGYRDNVNAVISNAQNMKKFSVFGTTDSVANIDKTERDYSRIKDVNVTKVSSRAIEQYLQHDISIYVMLALMIYVIYNIYEYRDNGMWQLTYTAKNGRMRFSACSVAAMFIIIAVQMFIMNICAAGGMLCIYGGNKILTEPVQCLTGYSSYTLPVSVITYLFIRYFINSMIIITLSLIVSVIFALCRKRISSVVIVGIIAGIEAYAYQNISLQSRFRIFRKINIINIMDVNAMLKDYENIVYGNISAGMAAMLCVVCLVISVLMMSILIIMGKYIRPGKKTGVIDKIIEKIRHGIQKLLGQLPHLCKEIYKLLITGKGWLVIAVVVFITIFICNSQKVIYSDDEKKKDELIVYLAHDIKTPLTVVIGYLSLLDEIEDMPLEQRKKYIELALNKSYRLEELINELFDIARFNSEKIILEKEELNLNMMIEQIIDDFYPMVKELNKSIKFTSGENITIYADSDKLSRVFNNLVKNAISYSKENTDIDIKMYKSNNEVNIEVINRGKMIPKDKLDRIFENFYRLDTSRTSKTGGSGLGLAISKQIVELHDGKIIVASDKDKTIFKVSLPIKDE